MPTGEADLPSDLANAERKVFPLYYYSSRFVVGRVAGINELFLLCFFLLLLRFIDILSYLKIKTH